MAKKEILIFTRNAPHKPNDVFETHSYTVIKHIKTTKENRDYKYPRITAFLTADQSFVDLEELLWSGEFSTLGECEEYFSVLLDSYWRFASKNKFYCVMANLHL